MERKDDRLNEIGYNNNGERMTIIRYGNTNDIDVRFDDGTIVEHKQYDSFKKGKIRNPMTPSVFGIGCIGKGRFKAFDVNGKPTKCYKLWVGILRRCYDPKCQEKNPTYKGCTVCKEWHNFQNFAEWYYKHYYEFGNNQRMAIDKDILHKGNKVYSPDNCVFVPQFINNLFTKRNKLRGELPIGVCRHGNKFRGQLNKGNERIKLGTYDTPEEAFQVYKQAKEAYIKEVAEEYKDKIDNRVYEALMNYEVDIND